MRGPWKRTAALIQGLREKHDLSVSELASRLGVTPTFIYRLESGMAPLSKTVARKLESERLYPYAEYVRIYLGDIQAQWGI